MDVSLVNGSAGTQAARRQSSGVTGLDRRLLGLVRSRLREVPLAFALWDGEVVGDGPQVSATIRILDRSTLLGVCWNPQYAFAEGYAHGTLLVDGDLVGALDGIYRTYLSREPRPIRAHRGLAVPNTTSRSRHNVHRHYDIGNDFYRLWLDDSMLYTCAYYPDATATLEEAQRAKLDYVCRKLRLRPGDRVVEAGSGWGALSLHMAKHYGAVVTAYNVSAEQVRYARERAAAEGLTQAVQFVEADYRCLTGEFDVFVSIGMLEHVGPAGLAKFGALLDHALAKPDGRGLLHFIGRNYPAPLTRWIRDRVFPGAYPPALAEVIEKSLAPYDFSVVDVENLRHHYTRTLAEWLRRYRAAEPEVERLFGPEFVRTWRLYLAGSEAGFRSGSLQLFQLQFARGECAKPWPTRAALYESPLA